MAEAITILSPADYLEWETKQEERHEYENGKLIAMGGSSKEHNKITSNLHGLIWSFFRGKDETMSVYQADMRVHTPLSERYFYPDIVVTSGKESYLENAPDTLLNPLLLIEVLSGSTEARDRGPKFEAYRTIDSLREYVLVAQDKYQIEGFYRNDTGEWIIREPVAGLDSTFSFAVLDLELRLEEVYQGVDGIASKA
ncbi:MAG: Uma2 family endonuclease [Bacteroidetes bacterium]|jgi:Uma2 family endonuclease|nr:Uma2 family endonuclease [Bacteroidota bacterium]